MKLKFMLAILAITLVFAPIQSHAAQGTNTISTGISQALPGGTFLGNLTVTSFRVVNGVLTAVGTISGSLTDAAGNVIGNPLVNAPIQIPIGTVTGSCPILSLHTGQIDLSLLGLNVVLSPIDLNITAQAAPGNLLGNLLCAVAHLLDGGGPLTGLANLLNQILAAL